MASKIIMPQGGQDIEVGRVVRWAKKEGEAVKKGEIVCEIETEKAVFEVGSPEDGILLKILVTAGTEAQIFSEIGLVGHPGESFEMQPAEDEKRGPAQPAAEDLVARRPAAPKPEADQRELRTSPKAKKLAGEMGISLEGITGSGPQGRITAEDVMRAAAGGIPLPEPIAGKQPDGREIPMSRVARVMARKMQQSKQTIPHFYLSTMVDMTRALNLRDRVSESGGEGNAETATVTDMIVRASAIALEAFPQVNCSVKDETTLIMWEDINIGIATTTDEGLVVAVLADVHGLSLQEVARRGRKVVAMAREGKQATLVPAHFTVSNLGMFNIDNFTAVINPPEVAILAVSSIHKAVIPLDDATSHIRQVMNLTLSVDHRAVDGAMAAQFLNKVRQLLEEPESLN